MKILFGQKYYMKDTSEVPSKFLVFCIEEYEKADWALIQACKKELSERMKLDWTPPTPIEKELENEIRKLKKENKRLLEGKIFFEKICWLFGINEIDYMKYWRSAQWLDQDIQYAIDENWRYLPYVFSEQKWYQDHLVEWRIKNFEYRDQIRACTTKEELDALVAPE